MEVFTNEAQTTVTSGGTTAPPAGTVETWIVSSAAGFPIANNAAPGTTFHVADVALPSEEMLVTVTSGVNWTVTRGVEGTTPVAHVPGFTIRNVVTAFALGKFVQRLSVVAFGADPEGGSDSTTAITNALNAASPGQVVYVPAGTYVISSPLTVPSGVTLRGERAGIITKYGSVLKASAGFIGAGLITFPASSTGQEIIGMCLDGTAMPANTAHGIAAPVSAPHGGTSPGLADHRRRDRQRGQQHPGLDVMAGRAG